VSEEMIKGVTEGIISQHFNNLLSLNVETNQAQTHFNYSSTNLNYLKTLTWITPMYTMYCG